MISRPHLVLTLLGAMLAASCSPETQTSLRLTVHLDEALGIDQLRVTLSPEGGEHLVPEERTPITDGWRLVVLVPDDWADRAVDLTLAGLAAGKEVAHGQVSGTPRRAAVVDLEVRLVAPCTSTCTAGETRCEKAQLRLCQKDARGCATFSAPEPCPAGKPVCSGDVCAAQCSDVCASGSRRCRDAGYQICGTSDAGCLDWGPVLGCSSKETCRQADGLCVLDCGGEPCACQPGDTQACVDLGECKGGVRQCVGGAFGDCGWQVGPTAEVCDGKDNDCSGTPDDHLATQAQPCAKQNGVCQGAVQKCGGAAGWLACADSDYKSFASGKGLVYEAVESKCDGQDNDCNGKTDEPAGCCQPVCSGKACGAADGCGGKCQSGSCGANATCQAGACVCQYVSCGTGCCAAGQTCASASCCTPSCGGRQCGSDPGGCGTSCGTCSTGTCNAQGKCVCQPSCGGKACGVADGCGGKCQTGTCGVNATCLAGACVCGFAPCGSDCCGLGEVCQAGQCTSQVYGYTNLVDQIIFEFDPSAYTTVSSNTTGHFMPVPNSITSVTVPGDFNGWSHTSWQLAPVKANVYQLAKPLSLFASKSQWSFKFLLNGQYWVEPPWNAVNKILSGLSNGSYNFVLTLP